MAGDIEGGGAPPGGGGGLPPGPRHPRGPLPPGPAQGSSPTGHAQHHKLRGKRVAPEGGGAERRAPGYSNPASKTPSPVSAEIRERRSQAAAAGQQTVRAIGQDGVADATFAQATAGASAKHVQSPYTPSNDMHRFATDLDYPTPAIDAPRFGAQPISEAGLRDLRANSVVLRGEIASSHPNEEDLSAALRAALLPREGGSLSPEFIKELKRTRQLRDNPQAKTKLDAVVAAFNRAANGTPTVAGAPKEATAARSLARGVGVGAPAQRSNGLPGRMALALPALAALGGGAAAAQSNEASGGPGHTASTPIDGGGPTDADANANAVPSNGPLGPDAAEGNAPQILASVLVAPGQTAPASEATPRANAGTPVGDKGKAKAANADAGLPSSSDGSGYENLPWDAFIAKLKQRTFDSLLVRLALRGEQQSLTLTCAVMARELAVEATKADRDVAQFSAIMDTMSAGMAVRQKLRDLNDVNLDQGTKLSPWAQDLDNYGHVTDDDANRRATKMDALQRSIADASRIAPLGPSTGMHQQTSVDTTFRMLAPSELARLREQGPRGAALATKIAQQQDEMRTINQRAVGCDFFVKHQETLLRRRAAEHIIDSHEGTPAERQRRAQQLLHAADEIAAGNSGATFASVVQASDRETMQLSVLNRIEHTAGQMQANIKVFDELTATNSINVQRADAPRNQQQADRLFRVRNGLEVQLNQHMGMAAQAMFNTTSRQDNRMECHRSGKERYAGQINRLWAAEGPSLHPMAPPSLFDRRIALARATDGAGPNPSPETRATLRTQREDLARDEKLEADKMLHARLGSTVSAFSAATLSHRYTELDTWFAGTQRPEEMHRYLTQGVERADLRRAPGLQSKNYSDAELDQLVAYSARYTQSAQGVIGANGSESNPDIVRGGFARTTCKAQMVRHFLDRDEAIANSGASAAQKAAAQRANQSQRAFFEQFASWNDQELPRHTNSIDLTLRRFEGQERLNKAALLRQEGFIADNESPGAVQHNLERLLERSIPAGAAANDPIARARHMLECVQVDQSCLTNETKPNVKLRRLESMNAALMNVSGRDMFQQMNGLLIGGLAELSGNLEQSFAELANGMVEDAASITRMMETLNQSLAAIPG